MKKVLSIVLSVAMVICLMPAMAFAADSNSTAATGFSKFSDASSITKKEAVSVLVGLGVINGRGDGTFDPKGDVTRAETSTLVSILVRSGDSSSLSAPSKDPFTDVAKDNWAAPYVAYGVSQGYLNGRGDGTFDPTGNVTTAQLATILEQILGYSKTDVAYQWPENAMAYANEANLLTGISKGANDNLDREEAAQMIFNALKATDVVKGTVTGENGSTGYSAVTNKASQDYMDRSATKSDENYSDEATTEQLVEKLFPKVTCGATDTDNFGRTSTAWKNGRTQISDDVTETPAYTYTSEQKDLVKGDLKGYDLSSVDVFTNGVDKKVDFTATDKNIDKLTGNGVLVELYTNAKDTAITKAVVVNYTAKTVDKASNGTITFKDGTSLKSTDAGYDAVKAAVAGDRVLVATKTVDNKTTVLDAYLATTVTGVVSRSTATTATIDGTSYSYASNKVGTATANTASQTVYLDKYGFIVDAQKAAEAAKTASNYVLVTGVRPVTTKNPSYDPYDKTSGEENVTTYKMNAVTEDGTVLSDVDIVSKDNTIDPSKTTVNANTLYPYDEVAGGYVLYAEEPNKDAKGNALSSVIKEADSKDVEANAIKIGDNYIASNAKTVTVSAKGSKVSATVANGVSAMKAGKYSAVIKNGYVTSIFVVNQTTLTNPDLIYVTGATAGTSVVYTNGKNVQTTGKEVTYYEAGSADAKTMIVADNETTDAGFYTAKVDGEGYDLTAATDDQKAGTGSGTVASVYADNNAITIKATDGTNVVATIADGAIRDTRDVKSADKITTAAQLATAVSNGTVNVTYVTTTANNATTVTQLYITK